MSVRPVLGLGGAAVALILAIAAPAAAVLPAAGEARSYVVRLRPASVGLAPGPASVSTSEEVTRGVERVVGDLELRHGFRAVLRYSHALTGFAATLTPEQALLLRRDPRVVAVDEDRTVELAEVPQVTPTGVRRVRAPGSPLVTAPVNVDVAVIDTGVSKRRTDELNIDTDPARRRGYNCVPDGVDRQGRPKARPNDWHDRQGHGTHVAGIVGAMDNGIGVVGVAPGARIWPIRVFPATGGALTSWVTCAIDWVAGRVDASGRPRIEVVNMSLAGGGYDSPCSTDPAHPSSNPDHDAICVSSAAGTTYVAAAGNWRQDIGPQSGGDILPAAFDEVIAVSALSDTDGLPGGKGGPCFGPDDTFASYSDYGSEVDLIAPGSCILSLDVDPDGTLGGPSAPLGTAVASGTSMASPTASGVAALYVAAHPGLRGQPDAWQRILTALRAGGTLDWSTATDPDGRPDRLVDVSRLTGPPGIDLWASPGSAVAGAGAAQRSFAIHVSRAGAFDGPVDLTVDGTPAGVTPAFDTPRLSGLGAVDATLTVMVDPGAPTGTYDLTIRATSDAGVDDAPIVLVIDHDPPVVTGPRASFSRRSTLARLSVPLRLDWSARDPISGVERYRLRQRVDGDAGSWLTVSNLAPLEITTTRQAQFGRGYEFGIVATDRVGNASAEAVTPVLVPRVTESTSAKVARTGTWHPAGSDSASGGDVLRSRTAGSTLTFSFTGRAVAWVSPVGPRFGRARVTVDGADAGRVDLRAARRHPRRLVFVASWDQPGPHTMELVVRGGSAARVVPIDAFVVLDG